MLNLVGLGQTDPIDLLVQRVSQDILVRIKAELRGRAGTAPSDRKSRAVGQTGRLGLYYPTLLRIEQVLRRAGFTGDLASIAEIDNQPMAVMGNVNLDLLHQSLPSWSVVTYDSIYDRRRNRLATMDFCIHQPRQVGLEVNYLTRGVMTFHIPPELGPTSLLEQWRLELEDASQHQPDRLWFMGADCRTDGLVCNRTELPQWGFRDGRTARLRLMEMAREHNVGVGIL